MLVALLALTACESPCMDGFGRDDEGNCQLLATNTDRQPTDDTDVVVETGQDTGDPPGWPMDAGDPLEVTATSHHMMWEFLDAEVLDEERGLVVGQGGFGIVNLADSTFAFEKNTERGYRLAVDGERAFVATRQGRVYSIDLSTDPPTSSQSKNVGGGEWNEDIAADGGLVMLAALDAGTFLMDSNFSLLGTIPGDFAYGVGLSGDRALVADGDVLTLYDVSNPASPSALDSVALRGTGRDIDFDGENVAVALGARGVSLFEVVEDALVVRGDLAMPGSASGVDLDGDWLWVGAWDVMALAWIGPGGPVVVGHETFGGAAMGIGAKDGIALVPAWQDLPIVRRTGRVAGPEVHPPRIINLIDSAATVSLRNWGAHDLEVNLEAQGFELSESTFTLAPGDGKQVELSTSFGGQGTLVVKTNDADEASVNVPVQSGSGSLGSAHPDFSLPSFTWPGGTEGVTSLSDYEGQPVFIAYWAIY